MPDPDVFSRLTQLGESASVRLRVKSALNPLLWLSAITSPLCFAFGLYFEGAIQAIMVGVGFLPILFACGAYVYWMLEAPDRLQSEDYQLRKAALELIEEKGMRIPVSAASVEAITNPSYRQLEDREQGHDQ
jgi:hypothetical protein